MILVIRTVPFAKTSAIIGWERGALKIKIAAPAVEGRANEELVRFLAEFFRIQKSSIRIVSGHTSRIKRVELPITEEDVRLK